MAQYSHDDSVLSKIDAAAAPLAKFDAFPKVPSAYKNRSEGRGFVTIFVMLIALVLVLNDIGEYIWGWTEFKFEVDQTNVPYIFVNMDMVVNMPCHYLSIDLRDVVGDRLLLTGGLRRDGVKFDVGQATALKEHSTALSASQVVEQSRKSRGLFHIFQSKDSGKNKFKPTYKHEGDPNACRVYGTLAVKRVTANLHITTLGHGYATYEHVDHTLMNLSHVITEFSFGPHFPDITQPLDNSFETTHDHFTAFQYFIRVVPTKYIAPRTRPVETSQYSVTHYTRNFDHGQGTPGIFFKFDLDPLSITIHQKTTTFTQLLIRCVGVLGGVFVCMGYAIRVTTKAVEVVSGSDSGPGLVAAEASGVKIGLRGKWGGSELRARPQAGRMVQQGNGWVMENNTGSPYASYAGTPVSGSFSPQPSSYASPSYINAGAGSVPNTAPPQSAVGLGFPSGSFGPSGGPAPTPGMNGRGHVRTPSLMGPPRTPMSPYVVPGTAPPATTGQGHVNEAVVLGTPSYAVFPPTPNPVNGNGFGYQQTQNGGHSSPSPLSASPGPGIPRGGKKDD